MSDSHPTDTALAAYATGEGAGREAVAEHVASCDPCRGIVGRLSDEPLDDIPDRPLPENGPVVPQGTVRAVADSRTLDVVSDQLWRAATPDRDSVQVVWIRRVRSDGRIAVVPVSLDPDHADDYSLIVTADRSPLGVDLVFHTTIETTIDPRTLIDCIVEHAGVVADITAVRGARALGVPVQDVLVGSPIVSFTDDRIEYRQQLSDALIELTSASLDPDRSGDDDAHDLPTAMPSDSAIADLIDDEITAALLDELLLGLWDTHPGARVVPARSSPGHAGAVASFATIVNIDVFVSVVTVATQIPDEELPELSRAVFQTDLSVHAVCFVATPQPFHARLIDRRALSDSYETPTGRLQVPEDLLEGPVAEVLLKFFDRRVNPFRVFGTAAIDPITINQRDLAVEYGAGSVRDVAARASGLRVPGKSDGYSRVANHREAVIEIVEQALTRDSVDIAGILDGDP